LRLIYSTSLIISSVKHTLSGKIMDILENGPNQSPSVDVNQNKNVPYNAGVVKKAPSAAVSSAPSAASSAPAAAAASSAPTLISQGIQTSAPVNTAPAAASSASGSSVAAPSAASASVVPSTSSAAAATNAEGQSASVVVLRKLPVCNCVFLLPEMSEAIGGEWESIQTTCNCATVLADLIFNVRF
jgi:hypothetical protein